MRDEIFIATGLTEGEKVRIARLIKRLRQVDIASLAKVNLCEVTALEKDRYIRNHRKVAILQILGLLLDQTEIENVEND